jgi:hypothetical protein
MQLSLMLMVDSVAVPILIQPKGWMQRCLSHWVQIFSSNPHPTQRLDATSNARSAM